MNKNDTLNGKTYRPLSKHELEFRKQLGERIRCIWETTGTTQAEFSKALAITTVTLSNYMKGNRIPDALLISLLSKRFDIRLDWIFTGHGPMQPSEGAPSSSPPASLDSEVMTLHTRLIAMQDKLIQVQEKYAAVQEEMVTLYRAGRILS